MKKVIIIFFILFCIPITIPNTFPIAHAIDIYSINPNKPKAENDPFIRYLNSLDYEQLIDLQGVINKEIAERKESEGVIVPPGVYKIGADIPEGYWDISIFSDEDDWIIPSAYIAYCSALDSSKTDFASGAYINGFVLDSDTLTKGIYLDRSNYLIIEYHSVIFTPHVQPKLGF